ncbi:MAG TPA: UDP-N-acetylmuramoyl-tripeptide--D-alanyl-D-alanine ligase [Candidatus Acidoferrum sp.]|nr:UDP-N-acetylmuramoyl-tripeptide--D-alanyl-D-alanine ligase [Candidatus Acidoferrum sp.]
MEPRTLGFIAEATGGELSAGSPEALVGRVCTDSRQVRAGDLFFALPGERFDGHDFVEDVARKGAAAVVVERARRPAGLGDCAVVAVSNTRAALGRLAAAYRKDFDLAMIAVCGSNGKTTTKELVAAVLRQKLSTVSSEASYNNDIGVPLTLLRLERSHQAAVVEIGTNHPGELAPLVQMARPAYGVLTCIGREHLEFFGDVAGVAQEEGQLAELLPAGGKLFVNGADEWSDAIAGRTRATVVRIGADWRARALRVGKQGVAFHVEAPEAAFSGEYRIKLIGRHQVTNALFAVALGAELGLSRDQIAKGLAKCEPAKMRMQLWEASGVRVLDDAYNANADSVRAALETLRELPCKGRRVAVLGDMAELGRHTESAHEEVGRAAAELGVGQLFAVGKLAAMMARAARAAGLTRVLEFPDVETAAPAVKSFVRSGDLLLLKASRVMRLERIAELLRGAEALKKERCCII